MIMNHIIINGIPSRDVNGLIILKYPPVTRAPMRIEEETIDGRHGSLITELGYDAYDKELQIGLTPDCDPVRVVDFFGTGGSVIFGNEKDKVYTCGVYEAIEIERLVRYRQATVKLRTQPFKLAAGEIPLTLTGSGSFINHGNIRSAPVYKITAAAGSEVSLSLNGAGAVTISAMPTDRVLYINSDELEVYDSDGKLRNSLTTGDPALLTAVPGTNRLTVTGAVKGIEITERSRWV